MESAILSPGMVLTPSPLRKGDKVRFVSPASTPVRDEIMQRAAILESWGLRVDFGIHAFKKMAYLAGTDEERLEDVNAALRDPEVRAIFATRGGKGSYRIADRLDFDAARRDPKFLVGFSDITALHLNLWNQCRLVGIHGAVTGDGGHVDADRCLQKALMSRDDIVLHARMDEPTAALTTQGLAHGRLIGGNLDMVATAAGWALPDLGGAILLLEAVNMYLGQVDRQLTMLRKAGHLAGLAGIAVGQFTGFELDRSFTVIDLLRDHLGQLGVPILGGLPLGHGRFPSSTRIGSIAHLDTLARTLTVAS
ncbi:MAG: S66 peptidase family protein [Phyllobacterium sp.]